MGWANARDVHTVYDHMKSTRECRLDDDNDDDDEEDGAPYSMSDAMMALQDMIKQRKLLDGKVCKSASKITPDQIAREVQDLSVSHAPPSTESVIQKQNSAEIADEKKAKAEDKEVRNVNENKKVEEEKKDEGEEDEKELDEDEDEDDWCIEEEEDLDPDAVWSSLDTALSEKGYTIYTTRDLLQSGSLPADLIELVARKVSSRFEKVKPMLLAQCPVLLPKALLVIKQIEDELEVQRLMEEEIERATDADKITLRRRGRKRQEEAIMHRVRMIGKCCMGFHWNKQAGGYRCAGGGHFVSNSMLNTYEK